jgi:hypothetical protein
MRGGGSEPVAARRRRPHHGFSVFNVSPAAAAGELLRSTAEDGVMAISTRELDALPDVAQLRRLLQSLAMLDAILSPRWESRYYSFNARWSEGEQMGSMRDGCGDDFFALFNAAGCFFKGFAHEAPMRDWPGVLDGVPAEFEACLEEPAFNIADTTFCIWRRYLDESWQRGAIEFRAGDDPDGSAPLLSALDGRPQTYQAWAEDYYERPVSLAAVQKLYAHTPLEINLLKQLNAVVTLKELAADMEEIGYPGKE